MADADDYESLPDGAPFKFVALAGAAAGIAEHCIMYPIDSVKVSRDWKKNMYNLSMSHSMSKIYGTYMNWLRGCIFIQNIYCHEILCWFLFIWMLHDFYVLT